MENVKCYFVPHPPLIMSEIGQGEEKAIHKTIAAYQTVAKEIAAFKPHTIIVISPHALTYDDYFHIENGNVHKGDMGAFNASAVRFEAPNDSDFVNQLERHAKNDKFPAGFLGKQNNKLDHGVMVPLHFINQQYRDYNLVRLSFSGLSYLAHYEYGAIIQRVIKDNPNKRYVFIASGDLSHVLTKDGPYGFNESGPVFDSLITKILANGDFGSAFNIPPQTIEDAGECGFRSLLVLAGVLDCYSITTNLLSYEGPFGVGYAVASFIPKQKDSTRAFGQMQKERQNKMMAVIRNQEDEYVALARQSLEFYVRNGRQLPSYKVSSLLSNNKAGVFVSLKKNGSLRGCIGTTQPKTKSIAEEIVQNAISAGTEDPRFPPVDASELSELVYSVDVLKTPEAISSPLKLDVKKYGVIVSFQGQSGLLLPNLEGVNTVKEQIDIALRKAGISPKEKYDLQRFEVVRHK
ncbi:MAG: AmmeMemoRadiSam system protein A [Bacteroidia bacterium]|nr:AmmeMemoRadiSam system protein A [Bacteroidia bacterium]